MADDSTKRGPADGKRINVNEPHEVRVLDEALGCSKEQLEEAVRKVGAMADDVRARLAKR